MNLLRKWLIDIRGDKSQQETAEEIGISRGAYANIELGKRNPSVKLAKRIANNFDVDWTLFFEENVVVSKQKSNTA
ncbi:helix-turn-helix transcriptional regulator [Bacillus amyloliquefaciens]|uniref:helix-turn-helix transcriptional regulator n=1 Tax=unclassified Bacillus (in: firmicutes) TaxID=185979 RepID=UPI0009798BEA|nr:MULTISPECIES: helix-turn-helix transcriptional regulator [Bacillus]MCA1215885.1 helix-turn-helix transcriptional regulator [Bacillus amyloliquefaciens]MCC8303244.1 helix-turn-helix transcriptional regulator [Bacillus sp. AF12]MCR4365390.1 helix-turn-helix transcriptional regulator [Bacillus amyloliquefaciens]MCV3202261.1 helix-turn-helix transcriptional regulator [Bacillus velezensis]MCX2771578.1 helix-turn-helix transcriptional regulator [Bacillus sp. H2FL2]